LVEPGIEPGTSGSVAKNSDHWTTDAVDEWEGFMKYAVEMRFHKDWFILSDRKDTSTARTSHKPSFVFKIRKLV
jgi:hypothetical protein